MAKRAIYNEHCIKFSSIFQNQKILFHIKPENFKWLKITCKFPVYFEIVPKTTPEVIDRRKIPDRKVVLRRKKKSTYHNKI